jgi:hypothetical protein
MIIKIIYFGSYEFYFIKRVSLSSTSTFKFSKKSDLILRSFWVYDGFVIFLFFYKLFKDINKFIWIVVVCLGKKISKINF